MGTIRIALANLPFPATPEESIVRAERAVAQAAAEGCSVVCFPECFIPGYRTPARTLPPPDPRFLEHAWAVVATAARTARVAVILGTERVVGDALLISALVVNDDGTTAGFQDKVHLDPSEKGHMRQGPGGACSRQVR
jgi:predicted amidohydrolase